MRLNLKINNNNKINKNNNFVVDKDVWNVLTLLLSYLVLQLEKCFIYCFSQQTYMYLYNKYCRKS